MSIRFFHRLTKTRANARKQARRARKKERRTRLSLVTTHNQHNTENDETQISRVARPKSRNQTLVPGCLQIFLGDKLRPQTFSRIRFVDYQISSNTPRPSFYDKQSHHRQTLVLTVQKPCLQDLSIRITFIMLRLEHKTLSLTIFHHGTSSTPNKLTNRQYL